MAIEWDFTKVKNHEELFPVDPEWAKKYGGFLGAGFIYFMGNPTLDTMIRLLLYKLGTPKITEENVEEVWIRRVIYEHYSEDYAVGVEVGEDVVPVPFPLSRMKQFIGLKVGGRHSHHFTWDEFIIGLWDNHIVPNDFREDYNGIVALLELDEYESSVLVTFEQSHLPVFLSKMKIRLEEKLTDELYQEFLTDDFPAIEEAYNRVTQVIEGRR